MIPDFARTRLLVVGDPMLDIYVESEVRRISPEAPVPVAEVRARRSVPGGAANVARNLVSLGCRAALLGVCGVDAAASTLRERLREGAIEATLIPSSRRPTTGKTRIVTRGQQLFRLDEEARLPLDPQEYAGLKAALPEALDGCDAVILSDYGKGVLLRRPDGSCLAGDVIAACAERGIPVLADPKLDDWSRYAGAECVTPNSAEFAAVSGCADESREDMEKAARALCRRIAVPRLLLTRGPRGMALFEEAREPVFIKAEARQVVDVSGAGDTVIAVLAACRACGLSYAEAARCANAAAGMVVCKAGTSPVSRAEFLYAVRRDGGSTPKIMDLPRLREVVDFWKQQGQRVVFTNGCFDILHKGHIMLLHEAAAQGDRLVVAINADASVRRLKGETRPVQDEQSRALLIAALQDVDAVIIFEEDTPLRLIEALLPDVLVKGSDYTVETVVGADVVQAHGGRVHLARLQDGYSTTGICRRISADGGPAR
ncbi:D-glycero-beta-D-manno-heptose 1-phosphate adenylyltransferase [uncultured Desulfovibrio sp.]|uniref:D-glycero-beta-D-manno-heptose 1-phosphate adenylyltransferase n=1 Tax=uncultured Desulfovibrio sp. TaxID=167968 RepID=UPI002623758B|nr:D-glycero-beta-D-manno-heptose 1-phosphate adenylyltransferase [uncultured Desulfovibrio sp.]